jgi:hypothetical protein
METYFNIHKFLFAGIIFFLISCGQDPSAKKGGIQDIKADSYADIIRHPVSMESTDTVNVAKISFEEKVFDFGTIDEGEVVSHTFNFINSGKAPLLITSAYSSCGCTVPKWPKEVIEPGQKGIISVSFNSNNRLNKIDKPVTILANTYPNKTVLRVQGFVNPKE